VRRRILVAILSITGIAVLLFGIPLSIVVDRLVEEDATLRIERQAVLAGREVPADYATSGDPVELPPGAEAVSLALYDPSGALVMGDGPTTADDTVHRALRNQIATSESSDALVVAIPVTGNERVIGAIRGSQPISRSDARTFRIVALVASLAVLVIAIGAVVSYIVAGRLARPVRRLRDAAVQLGDGDFTVEVPHSGVPELDDAVDALALTARRLDDLVSRERAFSADASHQLRTPLAGLRSGIETELAFPRADPTQILRESLDDIGRLERTIAELLTLARTPTLAAATCSLADVQVDLRADWHGRFAARGRRITLADAATVPKMIGSGAVLRHALDVLLDNALVHGAGEARVDHAVGDDSITIVVSDEGSGIGAPTSSHHAPDDAPHGLGLPIARRLITSMPGRLTIVPSGRQPRIEIVLRRADLDRSKLT
jgi:signal transduction histidine kinase